MNTRNQLLCAHSVLLFIPLLAFGLFFFPGWLPPLAPTLAREELVKILSPDNTMMRVGLAMVAAGGMLYCGLPAAISVQLRRIEGKFSALSEMQIMTAVMGVPAIILPAYNWLTVSYRPDLNGDVVQVFNDMAWFMIIGMAGPGIIQAIVIGLAILGDQKQIYPRWVGYMNLWCAFAFLPGFILPFFKTGPFAWNGLLGFWLVAVAFFLWLLILWYYTVQAIKKHAQTGGE